MEPGFRYHVVVVYLCADLHVVYPFAHRQTTDRWWNPRDERSGNGLTKRTNNALVTGKKTTSKPKSPPERRVENGGNRR